MMSLFLVFLYYFAKYLPETYTFINYSRPFCARKNLARYNQWIFQMQRLELKLRLE